MWMFFKIISSLNHKATCRRAYCQELGALTVVIIKFTLVWAERFVVWTEPDVSREYYLRLQGRRISEVRNQQK